MDFKSITSAVVIFLSVSSHINIFKAPVIRVSLTLNDCLVVAYAPRYASDFIMGKVGYRALPKCYGLQDTSALQETGILRLRRQPFFNLYGQGVLVGIIDAGIDFRHPAFVWTNNTSKILCAWNQEDKTGTAPNGISYGSEYSQEDFNHALNNEDSYKFVDRIIDENGHGTIMASVAAGREIEEEDFSGAAPLSDLVIVKLKRAKEVYYDYYRISNDCDAYQENDIMMALRYLLDISNQLQRPMVICLGLEIGRAHV